MEGGIYQQESAGCRLGDADLLHNLQHLLPWGVRMVVTGSQRWGLFYCPPRNMGWPVSKTQPEVPAEGAAISKNAHHRPAAEHQTLLSLSRGDTPVPPRVIAKTATPDIFRFLSLKTESLP